MQRLILTAVILGLGVSAGFAADKTSAVWADGRRTVLSDEDLLRHATVSEPASYPQEAQKRNLTGSGLYELRVDKLGRTPQVVVVRSAGSAVLDQAARSAFLKWRFKPGVFARVTIPVSWSVSRVR